MNSESSSLSLHYLRPIFLNLCGGKDLEGPYSIWEFTEAHHSTLPCIAISVMLHFIVKIFYSISFHREGVMYL